MLKKITTYVKASRAELGKVSWPSRIQVRNHSIAVIIISLIVALFLGAVDYGLNIIVQQLIQ